MAMFKVSSVEKVGRQADVARRFLFLSYDTLQRAAQFLGLGASYKSLFAMTSKYGDTSASKELCTLYFW